MKKNYLKKKDLKWFTFFKHHDDDVSIIENRHSRILSELIDGIKGNVLNNC